MDNNGTTLMSADTQKALLKWCNKGNPSASYKSATDCKNMLNTLRLKVAEICGVKSTHEIVLTSGASEANSTAITSIINHMLDARRQLAFKQNLANIVPPHVIVSAIEHKSILSAVESFLDRQLISLTKIIPNSDGVITLKSISDAVTDYTTFVIVMHANNETGAINDIASISKFCAANNIIFHSDIVQTFGKIPPKSPLIHSMSLSFHKLYGPPGCGAWIVSKSLAKNLQPAIFGTQNNGLRGGTENVIGFGATLCALAENFHDRANKNAKLQNLKEHALRLFCQVLPCITYSQYVSDRREKKPELELIIFSQSPTNSLCNTILISVVKRTPPKICNVKIKEFLERNNVIISVGSACNTSSAKASHVLYAMNADEFIRAGALRISFGDYNTLAEVKKCVTLFAKAIQMQCY